jgi:hypothetical protein
MSETNDLKFTTLTGPVGLGGWLILPGLGLFFSVFQHFSLAIRIAGLLKPANWNALTSPGSAAYDSLWAPLLIFQLAAYFALAMFEILLLYMYWGQRRALPQLIIACLIARAFVSVVVSLISQHIPSIASRGDDTSGILAPIVTCLVWIPYFLTSTRVKATFTL